jgi:hypothetical protein
MVQYQGSDESAPSMASNGPSSDGPATTSPVLGVVGLVLVGIYLVVAVVARLLSPTILVNQMSSTDNFGHRGPEILSQLAVPLLLMASGVVGLAGWIVGVVATVTNRGRVFGVATIIVGVVSFLIASTSIIGMFFVFSG